MILRHDSNESQLFRVKIRKDKWDKWRHGRGSFSQRLKRKTYDQSPRQDKRVHKQKLYPYSNFHYMEAIKAPISLS